MVIADQKVVSIHYTLKTGDGQVVQESEPGKPFSYVHGTGNIIPGLEDALAGKEPGDKLDVSLEPEQAYGERNDALIQELPREVFQGVDEIQEGMRFQAQSEQGVRIITVTQVQDDHITVDANHPLAGEALKFEVEVENVRDATAAEIGDGQAHD